MVLKENVSLKKQEDGSCCLAMDGRETIIKSEHIPIMEAIKKGCTDNGTLTMHIVKKKKCSRAAAGFILADCILSYSDYIKEDNFHYVIDKVADEP